MFIIRVSRAATRAVLALPYPCVWGTAKERSKTAERNKPQQMGPQGNQGEPGKNTLTMDKWYVLMGVSIRTWRERWKVQLATFSNSDHSVLSYKLLVPTVFGCDHGDCWLTYVVAETPVIRQVSQTHVMFISSLPRTRTNLYSTVFIHLHAEDQG